MSTTQSNTHRQQVAKLLHQLVSELTRDFKLLGQDTALTPERMSLLTLLASSGPQTINQLAERERVSAPAITRTVKSLEKQGFVIKSRSKTDQRVVFVAPTRKSQQLLEQVRQQQLEHIGSQLKGCDKQQLDTIERALGCILEIPPARDG